MKKLKQKLKLILTFIILALGWGILGIMTTFFHMSVFQAYVFVPVSLYLLGLLTIYILFNTDIYNDRKITNIYMLFKMMKFIYVIFITIFYLFVLKVDKSSFIVVIGVFYLFYLAFETYMLMSFERLIKKIKHDKKA